MNVPQATGLIVEAFEGTSTKVHHQQEFMFEDLPDAEERARRHHKHIRDLYPESTVKLSYVFKDSEIKTPVEDKKE